MPSHTWWSPYEGVQGRVTGSPMFALRSRLYTLVYSIKKYDTFNKQFQITICHRVVGLPPIVGYSACSWYPYPRLQSTRNCSSEGREDGVDKIRTPKAPKKSYSTLQMHKVLNLIPPKVVGPNPLGLVGLHSPRGLGMQHNLLSS